MRLDARSGSGHDWHIWDCEKMIQPKLVVWVDDTSAQYGTYINRHLDIRVVQAKRIEIKVDIKLILINPLADSVDKIMERQREKEKITQ